MPRTEDGGQQTRTSGIGPRRQTALRAQAQAYHLEKKVNELADQTPGALATSARETVTAIRAALDRDAPAVELEVLTAEIEQHLATLAATRGAGSEYIAHGQPHGSD